ncbi:MAG: UbiA family prenyltransferase [Candidatus Micrarchaeota archaeon]|nr:UbiA family prenyltransferase [Candidatus Micrarchaeota archaeon]
MKIADFVELLRPFTLLAPFVGVACGGIIAAKATGAPIEGFAIPILVAAISAALLNGASNIFNQACDVEVDRINKPARPVPSGKVSVKEAELAAAGTYLFALALAAIVNVYFLALASVAALLTILYSWHAVRLKNYGWIGNATIAVSRGLLLIVAAWSAAASPFSPAPWFIGSIFGLFLLGAASTKDFADIKWDRKYGTKTLPIIYGVEKAAYIIAPFLVLPFLLIPLGVWAGIVPGAAIYLSLLSIWGAYTAYLIVKEPKKMALEENHPSWIHMYLIMVVGYAGFAISYFA